MRFADIIGQERAKQRLRAAAQEGRVPHAQLLVGPAGSGKLPLALAYAQYLNCEHRTAEDSCGECPICLQYRHLQHPDLHFVFPIVKTDAGDVCDDFVGLWREQLLNEPYFDLDDWYKRLGVETKQGVIYEKESSEILRKLSLKSFGDGYKVMIIWMPEKMNIACSNKLLKLLEEPPEKTIFLLVSEQPEQLLPTIVSRTQEVRLERLKEEELVRVLRGRYADATEEQVRDWAHAANGSVVQALKVADSSEQSEQFLADFMALMRNAWLVGHKKDYNALLSLRQWSLDMADAKVGREKQKAFLQYAQGQLRENFIANYGVREANYQTAGERSFSAKFAPFIHSGNVEGLMDEYEKAQMQIEQNGNAKIIFFDLCLRTIVLIK